MSQPEDFHNEQIPPWIAARSTATDSLIWNCDQVFEFKCPQEWEKLGTTESPGIRNCDLCRRNVYLCKTPEEFVSAGELGRCVAIRRDLTPSMEAFELIGSVSGRFLEEEQKHKKWLREWWEAVFSRNPDFEPERIAVIRRELEHPIWLSDKDEIRAAIERAMKRLGPEDPPTDDKAPDAYS